MPTSSSLRSFAEDPPAFGADFPAESERRRILTDRYCLLFSPVPSATQISRPRRRSVYRALVRARWDDAAAGTTALAVHARLTSRPILERRGITPVGEIEILLDPTTC